jgi:hypothetical protein
MLLPAVLDMKAALDVLHLMLLIVHWCKHVQKRM